ncbi:MAG: 30S ribosomal protein S4 [Thermoplasmata archaeon]|nr:30S ribosomal protein S4 [Thermoplasmata archaeon]
MGDPKFLRRTYDTPKHPWEGPRMEEERRVVTKYGLKNKREFWKAQSVLRNFRGQARELQARLRAGQSQAVQETKWLLDRLTRMGLLSPGSPTVDDVLALSVEGLLERRLDWLTFQRGLAPTAKSARKMIVHGHVSLNEHRVTRPGYLVRRDEEPSLSYAPTSPLTNEEHPIRTALREKATAPPVPAPVESAEGGT